jgi:hypothetical protein
MAVAETSGLMGLLQDAENSGGHRLVVGEQAGQAIGVDATTLDGFFASYGRPIDVIKIDIEGAEALAWRGMQRLLARNPDVRLMIELWPDGLRRYGDSAATLLEMCERSGFVAYHLEGEPPRPIRRAADELTKICRQGEGHTNVFLFRAGLADSAQERDKDLVSKVGFAGPDSG